MPLKGVAVDGDVTGSVGTGMYPPATAGTWSAPTTVNTTKYEFFTIGGVAVIHAASGTFTFSGTDTNGATVTGSSDVTLTASSTTLQKGSTFVLRHDDETTPPDTYGNKLVVSAAHNLRSD